MWGVSLCREGIGIFGMERGCDGAFSRMWGVHTIPLSGYLVSSVAEAPRVVVDGFTGVDLHVFLAGAAAVEVCDCLDDALPFWRDGERVLGVGLVVDVGGGVLGGILVAGEGLGI